MQNGDKASLQGAQPLHLPSYSKPFARRFCFVQPGNIILINIFIRTGDKQQQKPSHSPHTLRVHCNFNHTHRCHHNGKSYGRSSAMCNVAIWKSL